MEMIEKWLLKFENGELSIETKSVGKFFPINRYLDEVGNYLFEFLTVNGIDYLCVYDPSEKFTKKTKLLVSKSISNTLVDLDESDRNNMEEIVKHYFDYKDLLRGDIS